MAADGIGASTPVAETADADGTPLPPVAAQSSGVAAPPAMPEVEGGAAEKADATAGGSSPGPVLAAAPPLATAFPQASVSKAGV